MSVTSPTRSGGGTAETRSLLFLAVWAPGVYGTDPAKCNRTFVVLSFKVTEDASAYVQFLSDPLHDAVLWEVSSSRCCASFSPHRTATCS